MKYVLDYKEYADCARLAVAEGQVLLKNKDNTLPLNVGSTVAIFGRIQLHYYKSGTGSGGMVNVSKVTGITDALLEAQNEDGRVKVYEPLLNIYKAWEEENPFDEGVGWGQEPWCQVEMPLLDDVVKDASENADYAIVVIGRTAGEDRDNSNEEGSYLLSAAERDMLKIVRAYFKRVIVVLNVGNIIDMKFVDEFEIDAVLYAWQGGMIGGLGTADVLTGRVNPSGKLPDTIAKSIEDYPSDKNFGNKYEAFYAEDIFVGYRYFETFAKDRVLYPFGLGLSYTEFDINALDITQKENSVSINVSVKNAGAREGKETVQIYVKAPNGKLGKSARVLAAFEKTKLLSAGDEQTLSFDIPFSAFASFDDENICGLGTGFLLEKGIYEFFIGADVRSAALSGSIEISEDTMLEALENALGCDKPFEKMVAVSKDENDTDVTIEYKKVKLRKDTLKERRDSRLPEELPITGDKGYKLKDVKDKKVSMDDFIAQLSTEELCTIIRGEGMGSSQTTPGTASAFGGISPALKEKGIPVGCMDDGPSGMRLDSGVKAFSLPNGTLLAATFNPELVKKLYAFLGVEMLKNKVDVLLGPGMNIHRHPLNGRNFEYFSEDPYLTGIMGAAQFEGMQSAHVSGTMKHFACNNQEVGRQQVDAIVSERALREIYLKGFEIAAKSGADSVMTTYCRLNGIWTSGNYDLNTTILRNQWGFEGIVMTDWWAQISEEGRGPSKTNFAAMVRAQNDMYMCVPGALDDVDDNARSSVADGSLTIGELQRTAKNVCGFLMKYAPFIREFEEEIEVEVKNAEDGDDDAPIELEYIKIDGEGTIDLSNIETQKGDNYYFGIELAALGEYEVTLTGRGSFGNELAQLPVVLFIHTLPACSYTFRGTGEWTDETRLLKFLNKTNIMHLYFGIGGIEVKELRFKHVSNNI